VTILDLLFEAWRDEVPPPVVRLRDAIEETYAAARVLGLDADELYARLAPLEMRIDAWLCRTSKLLRRAA
jgi:hypothetical protein